MPALLACALACLAGLAFSSETQFMPLEDVKAGMKGKALTTFRGYEPVEFDVEILGVLKRWRPGGDLILARASGDEVEYTGVAAGMSGSPVYVDGKLVGAIAYTWDFSKEPIAGITPIQEMLEVGGLAPETGTKLEGADGRLGGGMRQIGTPVMVGGMHPIVLGLMEGELKRYNMLVAQTGAGAEVGEEGRGALVPGAPLAAQMVSGDAVVAAMGTVTHVEGKRIIGFGHGLFTGGPVEAPMSGAYVHAVLPSLVNSVKLGSASKVVGAITNDGVAGVAGEVGRPPAVVPVDVVVSVGKVGEASEAKRYHFEIMKHNLFTPVLVGWTAASAAVSASGGVGELTVLLNASILIEREALGEREVKFQTSLFSVNAALELSELLSQVVDIIMNNEFERVRVKSIDCGLAVLRERRVAVIDEVYVTQDEVAPGDVVTLAVKLRPYRGKPFTKHMELRLPQSLSGGVVSFRICGAPGMNEWERASTSRRPVPESLEQFLAWVEGAGRADRLECAAYVESGEATVGGEVLPSIPESLYRVMKTPRREGGISETSAAVVASAFLDTEFVLEGCKNASVRLKDR